ncbi:iron-sulfur cluster assembly scaffold protein [Legionella sp. km772]|uniref:iron-sulfur cluster assembly scaffold protein n=1 Tax=Legionella sp. km772 TaxID=2498111 RepID=UPI000F8DE9F0|nr:iron-sulfur cluster assembly scaffold protein [Legionella sp. km772]RUR09050.1 hypothetical protein ELY15_09765 [Legionella sp. km772]
MMYNELVEDCFFFPKHVGVLDSSEPRTVYYSNASFSKNAVISLYMQCTGDKRIKVICFKSNGNPYLIAALEWLCRQVNGKKLAQWCFNGDELIKLLDVPFNHAPVIWQVQDAYQEILMLMNKKIEGES